MTEQRRLQLRGVHHVTAICSNAERTLGFYRDVLGLGVVHDGPSDDDSTSRHLWLGAGGNGPGHLLTFMEYPQLPRGTTGTGATHHFALVVETAEELRAWVGYLRGQGVECTEVMSRSGFESIYVRDPDGHLVEIATRGPGLADSGPRVTFA